MTRRLAIIPARGGSKRIIDKNIKSFCGKPMIAYILAAAQASSLFDVIHVSTDSSRIIEVVEGLNFPIRFTRPIELADEYTPIMPVLKNVVTTFLEMGELFDEVWLLMACSPLLMASDLREASTLFDNAGSNNCVLGISEYPVPVEWAFKRLKTGEIIPQQPGMFAVRSQDLEKKYFDAGAFAIYPSAKVLSSEGAGSDSGMIGYVLPKGRAIDIDDESDWILAEAMYLIQSKKSQC